MAGGGGGGGGEGFNPLGDDAVGRDYEHSWTLIETGCLGGVWYAL